MRRLLDVYISAKDSTVVQEFGDDEEGVIELIVRLGVGAADALASRQGSQSAAAATIVNNVRRIIIGEGQTNPRYFDRMSELLAALIEEQKPNAIVYAEYLRRLTELATQVARGERSEAEYPAWADTRAKRALLDLGLPDGEGTARAVDTAVRESKPADWVGHNLREKRVVNAVRAVLRDDFDGVDELMNTIRAQDGYETAGFGCPPAAIPRSSPRPGSPSPRATHELDRRPANSELAASS